MDELVANTDIIGSDVVPFIKTESCQEDIGGEREKTYNDMFGLWVTYTHLYLLAHYHSLTVCLFIEQCFSQEAFRTICL